MRYSDLVPKRFCEVTVETSSGQRHTITVEAASVFLAAIEFFSRARSRPAEKLPLTDHSTVYEVRVLYRVTEKALLAWANREAQRTHERRKTS